MPGFDVVCTTALSAPQAWKRVTDWRRHQDFVPFTKITVSRDPVTGSESFVARTAVGPLGFDDPMTVTYARAPTLSDPGVARIVKRGPFVVGWAVLTVTPSPIGSEVHWHEQARLRGTRGPVVALVDKVVAGGFGRILDGLLAT
jgi:hypothetical protein